MSKTVLMALGVVILIIGIVGLIPSWALVIEPAWYCIVKIVIGIAAIAVPVLDKK